MSEVADKSGLTAWQRWELPAFDAQPEESTPAVALPTAEEVEQIHQQAHDEGYQAGYAEGAQKAREEEQAAREEKQAVREEAQRLAQLMGVLNQELQQVDQQVAQSLLDLSLELAKQMLRQALRVKPELLLGTVSEAIAELPHFNQHARLHLHPADAELVRESLGEQMEHNGWKIVEDAQMERGGCRVETAHTQVDATLATRWKHIVSSIGQDDSWLEP